LQLTENKISVIAPKSSSCSGLEFVIQYILKNRLGLHEFYIEYRQNVDAYSIELNNEPVFRFPASNLFEKLEKYLNEELTPSCSGEGDSWQPFMVETTGIFDVNFDVFAAAFYLIARIDEVLPSVEKDKHQRFTVQSSLQFKYKAHRYPVIDIWIQKLGNAFAKSGVNVKSEPFYWWNTVDVDQVFASYGKPFIKRVGRPVKKVTEFKLGEAQKLAATFVGKPDPFDVLPLMHSTKSRDIAFYLVGGNTEYDHPETRNEALIQESIYQNKQRFEIGLHPSYATFNDLGLLENEKSLIEGMMDKEVAISRQHYLHYNWPQTPKLLEKAGVTHDFTMGFADEVGFRAGTSRPFPFFDVLKNTSSNLIIVPFCVMDVTLKHYMGLNKNEAKALIIELIENVRACNGLFVSLWHNESLSEIDGWKGWRNVYLEMKEELTK
jgi:hypothetical protein